MQTANTLSPRIGVIGTGSRLRGVVRLLLEADPGIRVVAIHDPDPGALSAFREAVAPRAEACGGAADLCARDDVDWVFVGSFNCHHAEHACLALRAGKHVFCEKPLALSLAEAEAMHAAWRESGKTFALGLVLRHAALYRAAREVLRSGRIGRVLSFEFNETLLPDHGGYIHGNWRRHARLAGSHLLEKCCHDLDLALWLMDDLPVRVASFGGTSFFTAVNRAEQERLGPRPDGRPAFEGWSDPHRLNPFNDDKDIVDHQVAILDFAGGAKATFHTQCLAVLPERRFYVLGSRGSMRLDAYLGRLEVAETGWNKVPEVTFPAAEEGPTGHAAADLPMARELAACLRGEGVPAAGIAEGVRSLVLAEAIDRARETGTVVDLRPAWETAAPLLVP